ncbi:hypothetical protein RO3G_08136 [Lichtheimia corymbifera JMRC:FSU:9682]|uniref:Uncharacterized protein n=1 Tax=Lichtheimia corymbifera JMRC:FSU:9682 TaxID=1263082 RepID=A0A068S7V9_9FUNG|nr:hypothetical protein RO3G_08136 [Lichtheimia corymbifera JMRC:FSU:9682]
MADHEATRGLAVTGDIPQQHQQHHAYSDEPINNESGIQSSVLEEYSEKPPPPPPARFYKKKKYWIICSILTAIIVVVVVLLIVFVFFPMIAQSLMNQSGIDVGGAQITFSPPSDNMQRRDEQQQLNMNTSFYMSMKSQLSNTGPFPATLKFHNPIDVLYNDTLLGTITLPDGSISGGKGELDADTPFMITNTTYFAAFSKEMLANDEFKWRLKGKLDITALSRTATVDLDKEISIPGKSLF